MQNSKVWHLSEQMKLKGSFFSHFHCNIFEDIHRLKNGYFSFCDI